MTHIISHETVVAYSQCPWKAFLLLRSEDQGTPHEYVQLLEEEANRNRFSYLKSLDKEYPSMQPKCADVITDGEDVLIDSYLKFQDLETDHCVLYKTNQISSLGNFSYSPTIIFGTHQVTKEQKLALLFSGYVLGKIQNKWPLAGTIVSAGGQSHKVRLDVAEQTLKPILETLRGWAGETPTKAPQLILNKHCSLCQFQMRCLDQAERDENLSLLDRITTKKIQLYNKKGIFTVTQLSYVFKPRRCRKCISRTPVSFNVELQALALRTGKVYIQKLPELSRQHVEYFLDLEGIPDQDFHYLIGILINEQGNRTYFSFWANSLEDESRIWNEALAKINEHPDAPIYHYGNYEPRAIESMAQKYHTQIDLLKKRLININASIYGKLYFPSRSNSLKELGKHVGASWSAPDASGLQSLVWRHQWEKTGECRQQEMIITYNREDCEALWLLAEELTKIITNADSHVNIDFADLPKQYASENGNEIHNGFESILRYAHADYNKKRVKIRLQDSTEPDSVTPHTDNCYMQRITY